PTFTSGIHQKESRPDEQGEQRRQPGPAGGAKQFVKDQLRQPFVRDPALPVASVGKRVLMRNAVGANDFLSRAQVPPDIWVAYAAGCDSEQPQAKEDGEN